MLSIVVVGMSMMSACTSSSSRVPNITPIKLSAPNDAAPGEGPGPQVQEPIPVEEPQDVAGYIERGSTFYTQGDYGKAIADFSKAIDLAPDDPDAYINRGSAYARQMNFEEAIADYDKAIELREDDPNAYTGRGATYYLSKDYEQAIEDFDKAIELDPDYAGAYYNRGLAYNDNGDAEKARDDFEQARELTDDPQLKQQIERELQELEK